MRVISFFAVLAFAACSSTTPSTPTDHAGSCDLLATRCHASTTPRMKECHELGHDGDDAKCGARREECLAECPEEAVPADGGGGDAPADASSVSDAGDAAADPACVALCDCLGATCASQNNYPFEAPGSCETACAGFSASDRACFRAFCEKAADGGSKAHDCDHATGKLGSQECP